VSFNLKLAPSYRAANRSLAVILFRMAVEATYSDDGVSLIDWVAGKAHNAGTFRRGHLQGRA